MDFFIRQRMLLLFFILFYSSLFFYRLLRIDQCFFRKKKNTLGDVTLYKKVKFKVLAY